MESKKTNTENNTKAKLVFVDSNSKTMALEGKAQKTWHSVKNGSAAATALMCDIFFVGTSGILAQNVPRVAGIVLSIFSSYQLKKTANGKDVIPKKWRKKSPTLQKTEDLLHNRPWECCMGMSIGVSALFSVAGIVTEIMNPELSGFTEVAKASLTNFEVWYGLYGIFAKIPALFREDKKQTETTDEEAHNNRGKKNARLRKSWNTVKKNGLKISSFALTPNIYLRTQTGLSEMARYAGDPIKHASGCMYTSSVVPCGIFLITKWFADKNVAGLNFENAMNKKEKEGKIIRFDQNGIKEALTVAKVSKERQAKIIKAFEKSGNYKPIESVLVRHLEKGELFKVLDTSRQNGKRAAA